MNGSGIDDHQRSLTIPREIIKIGEGGTIPREIIKIGEGDTIPREIIKIGKGWSV